MSDIDHHQQFAAELGVWRQVLAFLPLPQLVQLRAYLRHHQQIELTIDRPLLEVVRKELLHEVCDRLVAEFGWPRDYLASVLDMTPAAPDDLSGLPEAGADT
jgi:hypothetical protein